ncbi:dermonecrotic toxin domain-containing protein [Pseudomonas shirazensis]|uniref:dermonecrotic toxin domain-containing protein n=1 Tax=Pseudomonas shirazensis TaxID=2745494 RepID=UPI003D27F627
MTHPNDMPLADIARRYLGQFPDLHGLARRAAGHVLRRQLGHWLDPDQVFWHEFDSASSSPRTYTGFCHGGPPKRSMSLTELMIQRFSPAQQANSDQLSVYGGFYRVDASHAVFDERNELRLSAQSVLEQCWAMDFAAVYGGRLAQFRSERGDDFCVLARARFVAAVAQAALSKDEQHELLSASLASAQLPLSSKTLGLSQPNGSVSGWGRLSLEGVEAKTLLVRSMHSGKCCLYRVEEHASIVLLEDAVALQAWLLGQATAAAGQAQLLQHFVGTDLLEQSLRPRVEKYLGQLAMPDHALTISSQPLRGDLFVHLRNQAMDMLASNAHERLTSNAQLRRERWLSGLQTAALILAPMSVAGWPVALISLGLGLGCLALHVDRALHGKREWRAAAWWAVVLDILFILLDAAMIRASDLFAAAQLPPPRALAAPPTIAEDGWEAFMQPAADALLVRSDQALARQQTALAQVPWADAGQVDERGWYLDAFSEPYAVYRDELGYGAPAIAEYSHAPQRFNNLWRGLPLDDRLAVCIDRSHALAEALEQIGQHSPVTLYRAASGIRSTGNTAFHAGRVAVGDVLVSSEFTSFTENPYVLWEVFNSPEVQVSGRPAFDDGAVVYVLEPGEHVRATPVAAFSSRPDEAESLMLPGRYVEVTRIRPVDNARYRFIEVRLRALAQPPIGGLVHDLRSGEVFDREGLARRLGAGGDDSLMRRFFPMAT